MKAKPKSSPSEAVLAALPFLQGLTTRQLQMLAACGMKSKFSGGELVFREGDLANRFYVILQGRVELESSRAGHKPVRIETLGPGDVLGWSWLLPPYFWHSDARVLQDLRVFVLDGLCIRKKCEENHTLGYEMLKRFAQIMEKRLNATRLQLLDLYRKR